MSRDPRELASSWTKFQRHAFPKPSADLARYVETYWVASWDYPEPYRQLIVPYPNVHVMFQNGGGTVRGVCTGHHVKVLEGIGEVFGVAFRPGCFRPFLGAPVSTITDRWIDGVDVFGADLPDPVGVETVEQYLRAHAPVPDPRADDTADVVGKIIANPTITRVDALARDLGSSVRQLQRLFAEYVGVGPKWVIRRYRLREVTERLAGGAEIDWAAVAADLGYADQAHFVRDFTQMFGESPTWYAERY